MPLFLLQAVTSYTVAATRGHLNASFNLGIIFLQGITYSAYACGSACTVKIKYMSCLSGNAVL